MGLNLMPGSLMPTPGDIANGFYPHLDKVGADDSRIIAIVEWLVSKGAPRPALRVQAAQVLGGPGKLMPSELVFETSAGGFLPLDAALVYNFPHVALTELQLTFGFGDPQVATFYDGYLDKAVMVSAPEVKSPIGAAWPQEGPNAFRPSEFDLAMPDGSTWQDSTGRYKKEFRQWVFVKQPVWVKQ